MMHLGMTRGGTYCEQESCTCSLCIHVDRAYDRRWRPQRQRMYGGGMRWDVEENASFVFNVTMIEETPWCFWHHM